MKDDDITVLDRDVDTSEGELKSISSDDALLISMGKTPELKRVYNFWTRK
jgi:choline transport protein